MAMLAKVAVSIATYAIDRPYDYAVPAALEGQVQPGMRVLIPFGVGNRRADGVILAVYEGERGAKTKQLMALLDDESLFSETALQLALWMRRQYFCTVYDTLRVMLPSGLWFQFHDCWRFAEGVDRERAYESAGKSKAALRLVELLLANNGAAEMVKIRGAFGTENPTPALKRLADQGIIRLETSTVRGVGDKTEQVVILDVPPEAAREAAAAKRKRAPLQCAVLEQLSLMGYVSAKELCYFTGASIATLRALQKQGLLQLERRVVFRRPALPGTERQEEPTLNDEQQTAFNGLKQLTQTGKADVALLYGVTGSGKTQVYIKLIYHVLSQGRSALVLVPEISLTPQLMGRFMLHFGNQVAIMHSMLSAGERCDEWKRIHRGEARVVVGTRSAVFSPLSNLGLIILDEEHEITYKSEQVPRYHARDVARWRCAKKGALLLLGSATPSVETMYHAHEGNYHLFTLSQRYNQQELPAVSVVDMKEELRQGNGGAISRPLAQAIGETVAKGEQVILFLNRRGANKMASCGECGQTPSCPRCSVKLTYHSANHRLMCHYCGHSEPMPESCPHCGGILHYIGAGTQLVEQELSRQFPGVPVIRMDADTVTATRSHERLLSDFQWKKGGILVGTQMVAKGLDFENVTLVGVVSADQSLYVDDFWAGERTFSLLTQVVGRAGRGEKTGRAIIQTCTPDNEVIRSAACQDYDSFYAQEIVLRQLNGAPPFGNLFMLNASGLEELAVLDTCMRARAFLTQALSDERYQAIAYRLLGPAPLAVAKVNDRYRYRLVLWTKNTGEMRELIAHLLRQTQKDKANRGVTMYADMY